MKKQTNEMEVGNQDLPAGLHYQKKFIILVNKGSTRFADAS